MKIHLQPMNVKGSIVHLLMILNVNTYANVILMYRSIPKPPIPPPRANPGAFDFFEKFWLNFRLCCQFRRSNAPPVRASERVMMMMMMMMSRIERTDIRVLFTFLFAVGSDVSILKAPLAAAISPFMSPLNPPNP